MILSNLKFGIQLKFLAKKVYHEKLVNSQISRKNYSDMYLQFAISIQHCQSDQFWSF